MRERVDFLPLMNVALLDPFEITIPSEITHTLSDPKAVASTCISFNRRGTLLAAGTRDGFVHIWDLTTLGIIASLQGHVFPVSMLSWSRCGRYLLSSSLDWNCIIWDLKTRRRRDTLRFTSPVLMGMMHPRFDNVVVIVNQQHTPTLLVKQGEEWSRSSLVQPENKSHLLASAIAFTPDGSLIFVGTTKGIILVYNTAHAEFEFEYKVAASLIKQIYFTRSGRAMIVNSNDRIIRTFAVDINKSPPSITPELKFMDSVDRTQWLECRISADGEYVVGACGSHMKHRLYIWDKATGVLTKMLNGPMEGMTDMTVPIF
jgi:COMPASS component SWD1